MILQPCYFHDSTAFLLPWFYSLVTSLILQSCYFHDSTALWLPWFYSLFTSMILQPVTMSEARSESFFVGDLSVSETCTSTMYDSSAVHTFENETWICFSVGILQSVRRLPSYHHDSSASDNSFGEIWIFVSSSHSSASATAALLLPQFFRRKRVEKRELDL